MIDGLLHRLLDRDLFRQRLGGQTAGKYKHNYASQFSLHKGHNSFAIGVAKVSTV